MNDQILLGHALWQWFSKWAASPLWGDFEREGGKQNKGAIGGQKTHTGENAQRGFYPFPHHV